MLQILINYLEFLSIVRHYIVYLLFYHKSTEGIYAIFPSDRSFCFTSTYFGSQLHFDWYALIFTAATRASFIYLSFCSIIKSLIVGSSLRLFTCIITPDIHPLVSINSFYSIFYILCSVDVVVCLHKYVQETYLI